MTSIVPVPLTSRDSEGNQRIRRSLRGRRQLEVEEQLKIIEEIEANLARPRSYFKGLRRKERRK